jgi:hypothetical protein
MLPTLARALPTLQERTNHIPGIVTSRWREIKYQ